MAKYECWVACAYSYHGTIFVEADSPEEAEAKALDEIGNTSLSMGERLDDFDEITDVIEREG